MEEVIPLFKSHYSLGRSILTLDMPKEFTDDRSDTVFDIVDDITPELKDVFLVEDSMAGFLEAYTNAKELKKKLIFGLRLTFCPDSLEKSEEGRKNSYKNIIFIKNEAGYKQLIKIYTYAAQDGFYYEPRLDFKKLKEFWTDDLILGIPFYDSFLYNNKYTDSQCIPDFSFNNPVFLIENNDTLLDKDMGEAVEKFCEGKYETVKAQSVYYRRNEDFGAYMTARCINKRTTTEKPNLDGMCSDQFSIEAWCEKTGSKIVDKPRRAIEEKIPAIQVERKLNGAGDVHSIQGQAFYFLQLATSKIIGKRKNLTLKETVTDTATFDGQAFNEAGNLVFNFEIKGRVFYNKDFRSPFLIKHMRQGGYLLSKSKITELCKQCKKDQVRGFVFVMLPQEMKIMAVPACNSKGEKICEETTRTTATQGQSTGRSITNRKNAFIDIDASKCVFIDYKESDLSDKKYPFSKKCIKIIEDSSHPHIGVKEMSYLEAHKNLLNPNWEEYQFPQETLDAGYGRDNPYYVNYTE